MLLDALTTVSNATSLTAIGAGTTGYSDTIDLSQDRDIGTSEVPVFVVFTTLPLSSTGGATLNAALQTSVDNATWVTLEETAPQPIANYTASELFLFRGTVPATAHRYLRFAYTPSAALTSGAVTATVGADWPRNKSYPRNYVA